VLVILSDTVGVSVGDLFLGAFIPGLMMSGSYALYVLAVGFFKPSAAPALPPEARTLQGWSLIRRTLRAVVPPIALIFIVLGSVFFGIATPTEAGAVGAVGACVLAAFNRRFNWKLLKDAAHATSRIVGLVVIILFCSSFFSLVFDGLGGKGYITNMLVNLPGGVIGYMIVANIAIFLLGVFLEFTEICYIAMPLLTPAASVLGIDLVWFSIVMAINLQTAFISPPVGFSLFYMQSVVPKEISTIQIHKSAIPFLVLQVIVLAVVIAFPQTVRWLVDISFK